MSENLTEAERTRLGVAYRASTYRIFSSAGTLDLRIGRASTAIFALLQDAGSDCWAIISAWNPRSASCDESTNRAAQARLMRWLSDAGYRFIPGENVASDDLWPTEETCCVIGMTATEATACGRLFAQNAVVAGGVDGVPEVLWCDVTELPHHASD